MREMLKPDFEAIQSVSGLVPKRIQASVLNTIGSKSMMGLPGFEPGSIAPEATSLDQTSRQPRDRISLE